MWVCLVCVQGLLFYLCSVVSICTEQDHRHLISDIFPQHLTLSHFISFFEHISFITRSPPGCIKWLKVLECYCDVILRRSDLISWWWRGRGLRRCLLGLVVVVGAVKWHEVIRRMISSGYNKPVKIIWLIGAQAGPALPSLSSPGQQIIKINNLQGGARIQTGSEIRRYNPGVESAFYKQKRGRWGQTIEWVPLARMKAIWDQISVESLMQTIVKSISVFCIYNSNWSPLPPRPLGLAAQHTRRDLDREHSLGYYWTPLTSGSTSLLSQRLDKTLRMRFWQDTCRLDDYSGIWWV